MSEQKQEIPAGCLQNARGHFVPFDKIKKSDLLVDELVTRIAGEWKQRSQELQTFKGYIFGEMHAAIALILEEHGIKRGGKKGNVQFTSYDGRYKLIIAIRELLNFGSELLAARELINTWVDQKGESADEDLRIVLNEVFATDANGAVSVSKLLSLRQYKFTDSLWAEAMQTLNSAMRIIGSKQYCRLYERDELGAYLPIPLDIAAV